MARKEPTQIAVDRRAIPESSSSCVPTMKSTAADCDCAAKSTVTGDSPEQHCHCEDKSERLKMQHQLKLVSQAFEFCRSVIPEFHSINASECRNGRVGWVRFLMLLQLTDLSRRQRQPTGERRVPGTSMKRYRMIENQTALVV